MPVLEAPYLTYTVALVVTQAAQTEIIGQINNFLALLPNSSTKAAGSTSGRDFDKISPEVETAIRTEMTALKAAIDAAPVV